MGQTFFFPSPPQFTFLLFTGLGIRRVVDVAALEPKPPNQQRALSKLPTELPTRKFLPISTDLARKSAPKVQKTCAHCVHVPTGLPFCMPPLVVGQGFQKEESVLVSFWGREKRNCIFCSGFDAFSSGSVKKMSFQPLSFPFFIFIFYFFSRPPWNPAHLLHIFFHTNPPPTFHPKKSKRFLLHLPPYSSNPDSWNRSVERWDQLYPMGAPLFSTPN